MTKIERVIVGALLGLCAVGCDGYGSAKQGDAVEAQNQANREIKEEQRQVADKRTEIRNDVTEKTTEISKDYAQAVADGKEDTAKANDQANTNMAQAQATANEKIRDANRATKAGDTEIRQWSQTKLDSLNAEIDGAKVKAQHAKPAARQDFNTGIAAVEAARNQIAGDFSAAEGRTDVATEKLKDDFDTGIKGLKARVDVLSKQL